MISKRCFVISLIVICLLISIGIGQTDNYFEQKILPDNFPVFGFFGLRLSSNNDDIVIFGDHELYCYRYENENWLEFQIINEPTACNYGTSPQINNDLLVVGSPGLNGVCQYGYKGEVYIYRKVDGYWVNDTVLVSTDNVFDFGSKVYVNDDLIAVKARMGNVGIYVGMVYLFRNVNGVWINEDILINEDGYDSGYATNIVIADSTIYISNGAYNNREGIVYIYGQNANEWELTNSILPQIPIENIIFGSSVYRVGDYLIIGASGSVFTPSISGQVYVFHLVESSWEETQIILPDDAEGGDMFGSDIGGSGSQIVIGAYNNDDAGTGSGSAYIFELVSDQWVEVKKIIPSDSRNGDFFGSAVSMNEDYVIIGAPDKNNLEGAVYVYDPHDTSLHANFAADVRNGNAPVTVQFTSVPQGNPTAYEWDFNSDGFIDSTDPHPQFTYQINGVYTVTLTVYDETGIDDEVKTGYIQVLSDILFGDVDQSGELDVGDLVLFVAFVLGDAEPNEDQFIAGDINYSGQIDIIDIVMVIHEILGY